jgi:hypothetical protein
VYGLDRFLPIKSIAIDDSGWGDLLLGVVIGALKLPERMYMKRRIPVLSFQSPHFESKKYLDDAVNIVKEIVQVMQPDKETRFRVCSGYVLSSIRNYLQAQKYKVEKVTITGELQEMVERSYIRWCVEVGVPAEKLETKRNFWTFLEWVAEKPEQREKLVKTGWRRWKLKWREQVYKKRREAMAKRRREWATELTSIE